VSRVGVLYEDMADDLKAYGPFVKHFAYTLHVIDRTMESTERIKYERVDYRTRSLSRTSLLTTFPALVL